MKKYLVLVDGLFALLGSAINFFAPILILAMGIGAYKDTFRYFIALNIWNVFIFLAAIASKYFLRKEKRIKKWIPNLFLIAGSILFLASILAMCENIPFLEGVLNGLFGAFTDYTGKITEIDNNKVKMVISMFGNDTVAEVNLNQIAEL